MSKTAQTVSVKRSHTGTSVVIFGKTIKSDKDAEFHFFVLDEEGKPERLRREYINGRNKIVLQEVENRKRYLVAVFGDKVAGVATTHHVPLEPPFKLLIDAPEDHSKDYVKKSIKTDIPQKPDLTKAIKQVNSQLLH